MSDAEPVRMVAPHYHQEAISVPSIPPPHSVLEPPPVLPDLASLPLWQRKYLAALSAGLSEQEAAVTANVTMATVSDWIIPGHRRYDPQFARAEQMARHGVAIIGAEQLRADSLAQAYVAREDAFRESRDKDLLPRDRLGNRRLVLEVSGALDGAKAQSTGAMTFQLQINIAGQAPVLIEAQAPIPLDAQAHTRTHEAPDA